MGNLGRRRGGYASLVLVGLALIAAGCGDDEDAATTSTTEAGTTTDAESEAAADFFDAGYEGVYDDPAAACEPLLTDADIEAVLGESVEVELVVEGNETDGTPSQCRWSTGASTNLTDPGPTPNQIQVNAAGQSWFDSSAALYDDDENFETLEGIGDDAWAGGGTAGVLTGDAGITVQAFGLATDDPKLHDASIELLEAVVANYSP